MNQFNGFPDAIKRLQTAFTSKSFEYSKLWNETCSIRCELLNQEFRKVSNIYYERLGICKHWRGALNLISLFKVCVAAVRECNGEAYFHTIQRLLPIFSFLDSFLLRYIFQICCASYDSSGIKRVFNILKGEIH